MGIKLDWEIESERAQVRTVAEDAEARARRGRAFRRLLIVGLVLLALVSVLALALTNRLREVEDDIRQSLIATVENEVAALRVGDRTTYSTIQRSDSAAWLDGQQAVYDAYQQLKATSNVSLTGRVLDSAVDGARGRVLVEEIIDGVPYGRVWFSFRYDDGWRHVPPDYTFWGAEQTTEIDGVTLRYFAVDATLATELVVRLPQWWRDACALIGCGDAPPLTVEIVPDDALLVGWADEESNVLRLPSPFTRAARLDAIFTAEQQTAIAALLAERLVNLTNPATPAYPADALYLRQAVISYTVKRLTGIETNAFSIDSFARTYGDAAVARLVAALTPDASMATLATAAEVESIGDLDIDWRDVLTWRLTLEAEMIAGRDDGFLALYATAEPGVSDIAIARYNNGATGERWVVNEAVRGADAAGVPTLQASATVRASDGGERVESVQFRLVDGVWRRAS
jgi:hypothetical protein